MLQKRHDNREVALLESFEQLRVERGWPVPT